MIEPDGRLLKGFTLVEVMILLVVVSILISGAFSLFFSVITYNKLAEHYSVAYKTLDSKIELLRSTSFDSIINEDAPVANLPGSNLAVRVDNNLDGLPQSDIKEVEVTISWYFKKDFQLKAVTYISKGGIQR